MLREMSGSCWQGKAYDVGLSYIDEWKQLCGDNSQGRGSCPEPEVVAYLQRCAGHFQKQKKVQDMMKFVKRFPRIHLQREFLRETQPQELLALEEAAGNFREAVSIAEEIGDWEHYATLSLKAGDAQKAIDKLLRLAQLEWFWGGGKSKERDHVSRVERIRETQPQISQSSKFESAVTKTLRDRDADVGVLLNTWNEVRRLQSHNVLWYLLNVMIEDQGCFTANVKNQWNLPDLGNYEALLEGAEIVVLCKRLWVLWTDSLRNVLRSLQCFAQCKVSTRVSDDPCLKACFELLGVRQQAAGGFKLQYPKASWLQGQCVSRQEITKEDLTSRASEYWSEQIFQVSEQIQGKMEKLYNQMTRFVVNELQQTLQSQKPEPKATWW